MLFHGEEFFCPLRKQQTFIFMSNTKVPHLIWILQNPHSHQRCSSLQEGSREVASSTWERDRTSALRKQELIFVISFTTYNFCSQTTKTLPVVLYLLGKAYLFPQKEIQLPPALETLVPAGHLTALVEANPGKAPFFCCTAYSVFTFTQESQYHITKERLGNL